MAADIRVTRGDLKEDYEVLGTVSFSQIISPSLMRITIKSNLDRDIDQAFESGIAELKRRLPSGADAIIHLQQTMLPFGPNQSSLIVSVFGTAVSIQRRN